MNDPAKQHRTAKGYLKNFSFKHKMKTVVCCYHKTAKHPNHNPLIDYISIGSATVDYDVFTRYNFVFKENGKIEKVKKNYFLEKMFGKVENRAIPVIRNLTFEDLNNQFLSTENARYLAAFITCMHVKSPSFWRGISDLKEIYRKKCNEAPDENVFYTYRLLLDPIGHLISLMSKGEEQCLQKAWYFYRPHPDQPFVTSDTPTVCALPKETRRTLSFSPWQPESHLMIALRPDLGLAIAPRKWENQNVVVTAELNMPRTKEFCRVIAQGAYSRVFGNFYKLAFSKMVTRFKDHGNETQAKTIINDLMSVKPWDV